MTHGLLVKASAILRRFTDSPIIYCNFLACGQKFFYKFDSANSIESRLNVLRNFRPKTALQWDQQLFRQKRKYSIKSKITDKPRIPIKLFWASMLNFSHKTHYKKLL